MCGFTGFFSDNTNTSSISPNLVDREKLIREMSDTIIHRGPDSYGFFTDDYIALGFRRLSIIDLKGGDQPIHSADGKYVIVFNGEIYNYKEIKNMLIEKHGCVFSTNSDTEVILNTYTVYKEKCASMLRGMFSFVIYDKENHSLYGARDYFGIKPFYYGKFADTLIFGSEIKSFLPHPDFEKEVNPDALKMYLEFQYSPTKECIFKNIFKLTPGCYFTYENGIFTEYTYFEPEFTPEKNSFDNVVKIIDETVLSSVEYHQIADVEVGSFLSGGVDSSYVASTVRKGRIKPMKTYSVGFKIEGFDETSLAAELCEILKIPHKIKEITPEEFFEALPAVQYHSDEPHANLSAVPLYYLSSLAAKDVKVVLSGEGADELFGGYDWYIQSNASKMYKHLPLSVRKKLAKLFSHFPSAHIRIFFTSNAKTVEESYIGQAFIMNDAEADKITNQKYRSSLSYKDITSPYYEKVKGCDDLTKKMYLDMHLWLPYDILLKADKMTMAHSLEARVPYLDREVWSVAKKLTTNQKMQGRHTKIAFRKAALQHIPQEWAERKKAGFMVPFRVWIKNEKFCNLIKRQFYSDYAKEFFDTEYLNTLLDDHLAGKSNNARVIYTVYSFLLWYEQYFILR